MALLNFLFVFFTNIGRHSEFIRSLKSLLSTKYISVNGFDFYLVRKCVTVYRFVTLLTSLETITYLRFTLIINYIY